MHTTITGVSYTQAEGKQSSETGIALLNYMFSDNIDIQLEFTDGGSGKWYNKIFISESEGGDPENTAAIIIHEFTHVYTEQIGYDSVLIRSISYDVEQSTINKIVEGYKEATAITVEEKFRKDMGYSPRTEKEGLIRVDGYGFWPWMVINNPNSEYYQKANLQNSISLMQGPHIWYDIIKKGR